MRYLSLFSGIEAATVAWHPLGWEPVAFAEIDPFPCSVLQHHYPTIPNLGSVTEITDDMIAALGPIDLVVGGSPCQDLSTAGKMKGLGGERSGLFHEQVRIFDAARSLCGARWMLWENVPGAFSTNEGRDFAAVVNEMAGCSIPVPGDGWGTEGMALGEHGLVEWAVLDAQWFGLAQRRKRVFALLDTGDWASRAPVLLERDSLRGDFAPSREAREGAAASTESGAGVWPATVAPTLDASFSSGYGQENQHINCGAGLFTIAFGGGNTAGSIDTATCLTHHGNRQDFERETFITQYGSVAGALTARHDSSPCAARGQNIVAQTAPTLPSRNSAGGGLGTDFDCDGGLVAFDATQITSKQNRSNPQPGDPCHTLSAGAHPPVIAGQQVRRLTPLECCRLQGFPDDYLSLVTHRGRCPPADGPMYKSLGNSMAVPVMSWIGEKIQAVL